MVTLVLRGRELIIPRGSTSIEPGDHVFVAMRTTVKPLIDLLFAPDSAAVGLPEGLGVCFPGYTTLGQLQRFFALPDSMDVEPKLKILSSILQGRGNNIRHQIAPLLLTTLEPIAANQSALVVKVTVNAWAMNALHPAPAAAGDGRHPDSQTGII